MAETQAKATSRRKPEPTDYLARVRINLSTLVKKYGKANVSRWTGVSDESITSMERGRRGGGRLRTFLDIASYMDTDPGMWFLPPEQFAKRLENEAREPFFAPARDLARASSNSGLMQSEGIADRSRYRAKQAPRRSGRTGTEGASNR